jgi:transcriptional repressor NrdR
MRCPKCGINNSKVIDSRSIKDDLGVRRRRECLECAYRFTTIEGLAPEELWVIKHNGGRQPYDREKLRRGIDNACYKRSVGEDEKQRIVETVTASLVRDFDKEVPSREIGERVMKELRSIDEVAFVRFASVYRRFEVAKDFIDEIKELKK